MSVSPAHSPMLTRLPSRWLLVPSTIRIEASVHPAARQFFGAAANAATRLACRLHSTTHEQGITLVHFSVQRKRFLWERGYIWGLFRVCLGGVRGS